MKAGKTAVGSQRYKCNPCNRLYTPAPKIKGYPDAIRQQAVQIGQSFRRIARQLGVDHKSVMNWVNAHAAQQPQAPLPAEMNNAEMDELFT